jgi:catechol 2,3-dioxygenase-like lactoylglutathione lyase family enzyme
MVQIAVEKLIHVNQIVGDFSGANKFYHEVFGAQEYMNSYHDEEQRDASLFLIGDTCIELFSPRTATSLLGRTLARDGDAWHSFEWKVQDLEAARQALEDRGVRLATYYPGSFLMTHPKDTYGMIIELCPHEMADDPRLEPDWTADPWHHSHPMGIVAMNHLSVGVRDLDAASRFITDLTGAEVVYETSRPLIGGRVVGLWVTDHVLELAEATSEGSLSRSIDERGPRQRAIQWQVDDLDRAIRHLSAHGLRLLPGDSDDSIAIDPRDNFGVSYQFTERPDPKID